MVIPPYERPCFAPFAINPSSSQTLRRAIFMAFASYAEFCKDLLQYQQAWMGEMLDCGFVKAIEDVPLEFHITPCLHGPISDEWE
nr:tryptophan 2-monooxygenase [Agrobacterium sp.] [Nicotiana noctiflora]